MSDRNLPPTHKRQKSSSSAVNYYFTAPNQGNETPQPVPPVVPPQMSNMTFHRANDFEQVQHSSESQSPIHGSYVSTHNPYSFPAEQVPSTMDSTTSSPTFTSQGYPSSFSYTDASSYQGQQYPEYQPYVFPKPISSGSAPNTDFNYSQSPVKQKRLQTHQKNNLSISSHFNLFNLKEEFDPQSTLLQPNLTLDSTHESVLTNNFPHHQHSSSMSSQITQTGPHTPSSSITGSGPMHQPVYQSNIPHPVHSRSHSHSQSHIPIQMPLQQIQGHSGQFLDQNTDSLNLQSNLRPPLQPAFHTEYPNLVQQLIMKLPEIDGMNINSFLLELLVKLNNQISLDTFYNVLYNDNKNHEQQLDTVQYPQHVVVSSTSTIENILAVFKSPESLADHISDININDIKLTSVNYHELLRTFLAIKILKDILVQVPETSVELEHTIPRLSIYKTYYIVCQKLISTFPSSSNTTLEQQKIILGQSKLGKLIKLVYPGLKIKRLGSRGESKYNYLGVMWNDRIVNQDVTHLCDSYDLSDLTTYFQKMGRKITGGKRKLLNSNISRKRTVSGNQPLSKTSDNKDKILYGPQLSFIKPFLKFPTFEDFSILNDDSWFDTVAKEKAQAVDNSIEGDIMKLVQTIFIDEITEDKLGNLNQDQEDNKLLDSFINRIVVKYEVSELQNIDLYIYIIVIVTLLPHLLLVSRKENHSDFLLDLRQSLINFVNGFTEQIPESASNAFSYTHASIFCIILKKLINVNDLLITFIKLIVKHDTYSSTRSNMTSDIQNYLISPSPSLSFENSLVEFNFKEDIVQNGLIFSLMGYNYATEEDSINPSSSSSSSSSVVSMKLVREEAILIEQFFKVDLVKFLSLEPEVSNTISWTNLLSTQEHVTLKELLALIDKKLLSQHFKSRYPILVYHNFISIILNDLLKHIYSKQQLQQVQSESSFGNWWVFNSFVEEYVRLMGEIVGLVDST